MTAGSIRDFLSATFLVLAVALVAYGLFGLSRFAWYMGEYFDGRLVLFDNGIYSFMWGAALLVVGLLVRLHHRRPAMLIATSTSLVLFVWKRVTVPAAVAGQDLFPDVELLDELIAITVVLLILPLADRHVQRAISAICSIFRRAR